MGLTEGLRLFGQVCSAGLIITGTIMIMTMIDIALEQRGRHRR